MNNFSLPYDLRIGVTGHRTLDDDRAVEAATVKLLDHIQATLDGQGQTPLCWTVVSALARGADRLVAEAVLRQPDSRLVAALPFPAEEYRKDFTKADDLAEFERLLRQASDVVALESSNREATQRENASEMSPAEVRNQGYLAAGQWVVDHCEILVAIWDGEPSRGEGGTAQVVQYALEQSRIVFWINAKDAKAATAQLLEYGPDETPSPRTVPLPRAVESLSPGFAELARFNQQGIVNASELLSQCEREAGELTRAAGEAGLDPTFLTPVTDQLLPRYVRADRFALWYQRRYLAAGRALFHLSAIAVTLAVAQRIFFSERGWPLSLLEFLALGTAWFLYAASRRRGYHEKWLRSRYIAERLRTALFTVLVGEYPFPRSLQAETPLPFYPSPKNWLLTSIDRIIADTLRRISPEPPFQALRKFLLCSWIADQRDWHHRNAQRKFRTARRLHDAGIFLFIVTMVLTLFHILEVFHPGAAGAWGALNGVVAFLVIASPAWGAAWHAIATLLEYERIATRSERMSQALAVIARQAESAIGPDSLRVAVREAAQVIGIENHEWWILLSFRELVLL